MEKWIDLRSDTVTQPTQEMREATVSPERLLRQKR